MAALHNLLLNTLNQMTSENVKLFIWHLTMPDDGDFSKVIPADLPSGSPRQDVVDKIVGVYGSEGLGVAIGILKKMNQNNLALIVEKNAASLKGGPTVTAPLSTGSSASSVSGADAGPTVTAPLSTGSSTSSVSGVDFLTKNKRELEKRIGNVSPLLSALYDARKVNDDDQEEVESKTTRIQKNTALLAMAKRKGTKTQEALYQALKEEDPALVEDLGGVL